MGTKKYKPTTPGFRSRRVNDYQDLTVNSSFKKLTKRKSNNAGRNNDGRVTVRFRGGGNKRKYRFIDFRRDKIDIPAKILTIEYDPFRTAFISLICYQDGEKKYIVAPNGLAVGQTISSGKNSVPEIGNALYLSDIPLGTVISCIELNPGKGASIARSAGAFAQLMAREGRFATVKLPSGETRLILVTCMAVIGAVSNSDHQLLVSGKAGRSRWLGRRPRTRPVAMNPVDHPMGGGEGRASGGHPRSRNGIPAKGFRTRSKTKFSNKFIIERRKK